MRRLTFYKNVFYCAQKVESVFPFQVLLQPSKKQIYGGFNSFKYPPKVQLLCCKHLWYTTCMTLCEIHRWIKLVYALMSAYRTKPYSSRKLERTGFAIGSYSPFSPLGQTKVLRGKLGVGKESEAGRKKASNHIKKTRSTRRPQYHQIKPTKQEPGN